MVRRRAMRRIVFTRDGFRCQVCGAAYPPVDDYDGVGVIDGPRGQLTLGHIVPHSQGGVFAPENLQAECVTCNFVKGPW